MPYKCDRDCFNKNEDGWCKDEWCRNPVPSVPYGAVYRHTEYADEKANGGVNDELQS